MSESASTPAADAAEPPPVKPSEGEGAPRLRRSTWPVWLSLSGLAVVCLWPVPRRLEAPVELEPERTAVLRAPWAGRVQNVHLESGRPAVPGTTALMLEPVELDPEPAQGRRPLSSDPVRLPQAALENHIVRAARRSAQLHESAGALLRGADEDWLVDRWAGPALAEPLAAAAGRTAQLHRALLDERRRRRVAVPAEPEGGHWRVLGNPSNLAGARVEDGAAVVELGAGLRAVVRPDSPAVGEIRTGMPVRFTLTRFGGRTFEATVASVSATAAADGRFTVVAALSTRTRFAITEQALAALGALQDGSEPSIPEGVLTRLAALKDEEHSDAGGFTQRLAQVLSGDELRSYGPVLLEYARRGAADEPPMIGMVGTATVETGRRPLIAALFARWFLD